MNSEDLSRPVEAAILVRYPSGTVYAVRIPTPDYFTIDQDKEIVRSQDERYSTVIPTRATFTLATGWRWDMRVVDPDTMPTAEPQQIEHTGDSR